MVEARGEMSFHFFIIFWTFSCAFFFNDIELGTVMVI